MAAITATTIPARKSAAKPSTRRCLARPLAGPGPARRTLGRAPAGMPFRVSVLHPPQEVQAAVHVTHPLCTGSLGAALDVWLCSRVSNVSLPAWGRETPWVFALQRPALRGRVPAQAKPTTHPSHSGAEGEITTASAFSERRTFVLSTRHSLRFKGHFIAGSRGAGRQGLAPTASRIATRLGLPFGHRGNATEKAATQGRPTSRLHLRPSPVPDCSTPTLPATAARQSGSGVP